MITTTNPLLCEIYEALKIVPHDDAWKRNIHAALVQIGGTQEELTHAFNIVKSELALENLNVCGIVNP